MLQCVPRKYSISPNQQTSLKENRFWSKIFTFCSIYAKTSLMHWAQTPAASFPTDIFVIPEFSLPSARSFSCCLCSLSRACSKRRQSGEPYLQKQISAQLLLQMWAEGSGAPFIGKDLAFCILARHQKIPLLWLICNLQEKCLRNVWSLPDIHVSLSFK